MEFRYDLKKFVNDVNGDLGFSVGNLYEEDLAVFKQLVVEQYKQVFLNFENNPAEVFKINEYHKSKIAQSDIHKKLWPKSNRILSKKRLSHLLNSRFFTDLNSQFDWYEITDEDNVGFSEVYFRLCRPKPFKDVGPLHADAWFWELGHGEMPQVNFDTQRIKFWFCLETDNTKTGLRYVPGSHKKQYDYGGEQRDGFIKPTFDETQHNLAISSLNGKPGKFIVFNDRLLHGGEILEKGTRVSLEFTLAIKNS